MGARVQGIPAPDSQNTQGKAGSLAGVWHVGAGTRQAGWCGGLEAGTQAWTRSFPGNGSTRNVVNV